MTTSSPIGPPPIESIRLVERFEVLEVGRRFVASSLPGHLIHFVLAGRVDQTSSGRRQDIRPGTVIWYHEDEWVEGRVLQTPWVFYSLNFTAPMLNPPDFEDRMMRRCQRLESHFSRLLKIWQTPPSLDRTLLCHSQLLALLAALNIPEVGRYAAQGTDKLWWEVESWARRNIARSISMNDICAQFRCSPKTVERACQAIMKTSPMKRLKQIRLSFARGLVRHSELNMTEIAARVGYVRVHEFSRDYRKAFARPPTLERESWK